MTSMENQKNDHLLIESVLPELEAPYDNLPSDPSQLLSESEHRYLNVELARLANLRQRVESESRDIPMA